MLDPVGHVWIEREFKHTEFPDSQYTLNGKINLGKIYRAALAGQLVEVIEESNCGNEYLVLGRPENYKPFIWMVDKRDTRGEMLPIIKKHGVVMPAGLSPIEEFKYLAELKAKGAI